MSDMPGQVGFFDGFVSLIKGHAHNQQGGNSDSPVDFSCHSFVPVQIDEMKPILIQIASANIARQTDRRGLTLHWHHSTIEMTASPLTAYHAGNRYRKRKNSMSKEIIMNLNDLLTGCNA